ncbi:MAG TPA: protein phosphatase CheZ [Rhodocyclaceae bacterium]|nr:protein phosphatase CheZ [Rhodocyclaceae bacterium]
MAKRQSLEEAGDSAELQALFDSLAEQAVKPKLEVVASNAGTEQAGDSAELQDLFDSVASTVAAKVNVAPTAAPAAGESTESTDAQTPEERQENVFKKIGNMTRMLHDTLHHLGYDKVLEETAQKLPDARERLSYISRMTEQAASRVLNAADIAKPIQDRVESHAKSLSTQWEKLYAKQLSIDEFKQLAGDTRIFIGQVATDSKVVNEQLLEIMMAQDFQDLTGQVIMKVVDMAQKLESELLKVLIEVIPDSKRGAESASLLNGPVINATGRDDIVTNQEQVDDLLETLGF